MPIHDVKLLLFIYFLLERTPIDESHVRMAALDAKEATDASQTADKMTHAPTEKCARAISEILS